MLCHAMGASSPGSLSAWADLTQWACTAGMMRLQVHDSTILTFVSSSERENKKPAAQKMLGMGASAHLSGCEAFRRSTPSDPKWLARSSVGLSSAGTGASGPCPCHYKTPLCVHTIIQGQAHA